MTRDDKGKKPEDSTWVHKALAKEAEFDLECTQETFMEAKKSFTEASTLGSKDKSEPEMDPSMLTMFLETCMKLLRCKEHHNPHKINIPGTEGHHEVQGPQIENPDITVPVKINKVNIDTEVEPKIMNIGYYWDGPMVDKVTELLGEYQELFLTNFMDLNRIIRDLGVMKITLKPDAKPVKQSPYRLNPKYKENVHIELNKMLTTCSIEPMEESDWVSPMVVQEKK
eukprot:PITA_07237